MPLFDVHCDQHGTHEVFGHDPSALSCPSCGKKAQRIWSSPATHRMDFRSGWDMGAGQYFYTKRDRENWLVTSESRRIRD